MGSRQRGIRLLKTTGRYYYRCNPSVAQSQEATGPRQLDAFLDNIVSREGRRQRRRRAVAI